MGTSTNGRKPRGKNEQQIKAILSAPRKAANRRQGVSIKNRKRDSLGRLLKIAGNKNFVVVGVCLPVEANEALVRTAESSGRSKSEIIRRALLESNLLRI